LVTFDGEVVGSLAPLDQRGCQCALGSTGHRRSRPCPRS
jgi:hypothetical protein